MKLKIIVGMLVQCSGCSLTNQIQLINFQKITLVTQFSVDSSTFSNLVSYLAFGQLPTGQVVTLE